MSAALLRPRAHAAKATLLGHPAVPLNICCPTYAVPHMLAGNNYLDGTLFRRRLFRRKPISAEAYFGGNLFRRKSISAETISAETYFGWPISAEAYFAGGLFRRNPISSELSQLRPISAVAISAELFQLKCISAEAI